MEIQVTYYAKIGHAEFLLPFFRTFFSGSIHLMRHPFCPMVWDADTR